MKKGGFTLVELLAVIVIIGILALITVPTVTNIIEKSQKSTFKSNASGILRSIKLSKIYQDELALETNKIYELKDAKIYHNGEELTNVFRGKILGEGIIVVNDIGEMNIKYSNDKYCATKSFNETEIRIYDGECPNVN